MTYKKQYTLTECRPKLEIIPPASEDFNVYGGGDVIERARTWAMRNRYLLVKGVPKCAHGIYMMHMCPSPGCGVFEQLDHVNLWVTELGRPFLLSHPYSKEIEGSTKMYAAAHGLHISSNVEDGWYSDKALPIRMDVPSSWPVWPIEVVAHSMLAVEPVCWEE